MISTNLEKSGASVTLEAELLLTLLLVAKLNSMGLVKVGLVIVEAVPDFLSLDCLFSGASDFLLSLVLMAPRSSACFTMFWPWVSLARYFLITSGVLAIAAEDLAEYLVNSGVLADDVVLDVPSLGDDRLVPSLLGVSLASLGLLLTVASVASTLAFSAALLGVICLVPDQEINI